MKKWILKNVEADYKMISKHLKVSELICRIMMNRHINGYELMNSFINPTIDKMHNPRLMKDIELGVDITVNAINNGKHIRICGDYDQDGNSSVLTLYKGLKRCNANVDYVIPHRVMDGYGINERIVRNAKEDGVDLIITCDNGISAIEPIKLAKELGMDIIVTDHHEVPPMIPQADAVINPKRLDCEYPFKELCGAGVAFKFIQVLYDEYNISIEESYELLEFVAMATVCDVVDLIDENRIIVKEGLERLNNTSNIGIKALLKATGMEDKKIVPYTLGFVTGPCVNASGRLDSADIAVELFLTDDEGLAEEYANKLHRLNEERKSMTEEGLEKIIESIETTNLKNQKVLLAYEPSIHESIAGIIAGRVKDRYNRPTIVITNSTDENMSKASARSIEEYNMIEEITKCKELLSKFGGHPMAAGFSLETANIDELRKRLNDNTVLTEDDLIPKLQIDAHVPIDLATMNMANELNLLEPFGKGNSKPIFADKSIGVKRMDILGRDYKIIKMLLQSSKGKIITGIYFGDIEKFQEFIIEKFGDEELQCALNGQSNDIKLDITYLPSINEYNGNKTLQAIIQDYR